MLSEVQLMTSGYDPGHSGDKKSERSDEGKRIKSTLQTG